MNLDCELGSPHFLNNHMYWEESIKTKGPMFVHVLPPALILVIDFVINTEKNLRPS